MTTTQERRQCELLREQFERINGTKETADVDRELCGRTVSQQIEAWKELVGMTHTETLTDAQFINEMLWRIADGGGETGVRAGRIAIARANQEWEPCSVAFPCRHCSLCVNVSRGLLEQAARLRRDIWEKQRS